MTEYLKQSFVVRMGSGKKAIEKCDRCGKEVKVVERRINRKPVCLECFKKPKM